MWEALKYVTGGISLVAFAIAAIIWLRKSNRDSLERSIAHADKKDLPKVIAVALDRIVVETGGMIDEEKRRVLLAKIRADSVRDKQKAIVICVLAALVAAVAALAISREHAQDSIPAALPTIVYKVSACIDGEDELIIHKATLQWRHIGFDAVGQSTNCDTNTMSIDTTLRGEHVSSTSWQPIWQSTPAESGALSSVYTALNPPLPSSSMNVTLSSIQARNSISIAQLPTAANDWTLKLDFNDVSSLGAGIYSATVNIAFQ
jgi:hypothetical protein